MENTQKNTATVRVIKKKKIVSVKFTKRNQGKK